MELISPINEKFELQISDDWKELLNAEFNSEYFKSIVDFLIKEKSNGCTVYPPSAQVFSALNHTLFGKVKVVIIGQDPYHGKDQANGLCFSVNKGISQPPSLVNIFKELRDDLGIPMSNNGDLTKWSQQGVLLLNSSLTVRANQPNSHKNIGWEVFTDATIKIISDKKEGIVFLLWGKFAQSKIELINEGKHFILTSTHPSPYSANYGFSGCKHFSKTNEILKSIGNIPIDWNIND